MPENDKPIFPRFANDEPEKQKLQQEVKQKLEQAENADKFSLPPIQKDSEFIHHIRPAYGPPPISLKSNKVWLFVGVLILLVVLFIYFFVFRR